MKTYLKLTGTDGLSKGESFLIQKGEIVILGRSRTCNICLSNLKKFKELSPSDEVGQRKFRTVDGKHIKIHFKEVNQVLVEDLSRNGTYLGGNRLQNQATIKNLEQEPQILLLGLEERFRMEICQEEEGEKENLEKVEPLQIGSGELVISDFPPSPNQTSTDNTPLEEPEI